MNRKLLSVILGNVLWINFCTAQTNNPLIIINHHIGGRIHSSSDSESFRKVQFLISLSNDVMTVGSTQQLQCKILNLSTNEIGLISLDSLYKSDVILTNNLGKCYTLTPEIEAVYTIFSRGLKAGESYEWSEPVTIGKNIQRGNYKLMAIQNVSIEGTNYINRWRLTSNLLPVRIKYWYWP